MCGHLGSMMKQNMTAKMVKEKDRLVLAALRPDPKLNPTPTHVHRLPSRILNASPWTGTGSRREDDGTKQSMTVYYWTVICV